LRKAIVACATVIRAVMGRSPVGTVRSTGVPRSMILDEAGEGSEPRKWRFRRTFSNHSGRSLGLLRIELEERGPPRPRTEDSTTKYLSVYSKRLAEGAGPAIPLSWLALPPEFPVRHHSSNGMSAWVFLLRVTTASQEASEDPWPSTSNESRHAADLLSPPGRGTNPQENSGSTRRIPDRLRPGDSRCGRGLYRRP
jgi:hypothetical protein